MPNLIEKLYKLNKIDIKIYTYRASNQSSVSSKMYTFSNLSLLILTLKLTIQAEEEHLPPANDVSLVLVVNQKFI